MRRAWAALSTLLLAMLCAATLALGNAPASTWGSARPAEPESLPAGLLPPGASVPDHGPSVAVYPPQSVPLVFDHRRHMGLAGMRCETCHATATSSTNVADRLLPAPETCDGCHGSDHGDRLAVRAGPAAMGACASCHEGHRTEHGNRVARVAIPTANLIFDHSVHSARNIGCGQCHGDVAKLGKASRDQLPRMQGCVTCHANESPKTASNPASGACTTCHLTEAGRGSVLATQFSSGNFVPARWMRGAQHDAEFLRRHASVAANDSAFCANCHKEEYCADCHDGRVRPRSIHPNDYLSMHAIEAKQMAQRCQSCHREQSFCLQCHQRLGIGQSGPGGPRDSGRFHPPRAVFSDLPRTPRHHAQEAARNLNACVSCHTERDCVACHGGRGIGAGFNPHPAGFFGSCDRSFARNPRPCLVCHELSSPEIARCR